MMAIMDNDMTKGLSEKYHAESTLGMLITYVQTLPDGSGMRLNTHVLYIIRNWRYVAK